MDYRVVRSCLAAGLLYLGAATMALAGPNSNSQAQVQQKFQAGGTLEMHLQSGGYDISGSDADAIVVTYSADDAERVKNVKVRIKTKGSNVLLEVENTPDNNFHATIEVPRRCNLWVRLTAGAIHIDGVEGDKNVESRAGSVVIEVPHPEQYGRRDASVLTGSLDAPAFEVSKGGLFRSFKQDGPGKYTLHVHVDAGEIQLNASQ
jgi:hypothetical protein